MSRAWKVQQILRGRWPPAGTRMICAQISHLDRGQRDSAAPPALHAGQGWQHSSNRHTFMCPPQSPTLPLTFLKAPHKHPHSAHFPAGPSKTPPSTDHLHEVQIPMGTRPKTLPPTHWLGLRCQTTSSTTPHGNHRSHTHTSLVLLWFVFYEGEKLLPTANPQLL